MLLFHTHTCLTTGISPQLLILKLSSRVLLFSHRNLSSLRWQIACFSTFPFIYIYHIKEFLKYSFCSNKCIIALWISYFNYKFLIKYKLLYKYFKRSDVIIRELFGCYFQLQKFKWLIISSFSLRFLILTQRIRV